MKELKYKTFNLVWDQTGGRNGCWRTKCKWGIFDVEVESRGPSRGKFFWFVTSLDEAVPYMEPEEGKRYWEDPQDALKAGYTCLSMYDVIK